MNANALRVAHYKRRNGSSPNPCSYGTFQRAIAGHPLRAISWRTMVRLLAKRMDRKARRNPTLRDARKAAYCGAIAHLETEIEITDHFRLYR
jgi:hypothetical protein